MSDELDEVWVFNANDAALPSACFSSKEKAEAWIAKIRATGILTKMPMNSSVYDWAIESGKFSPKGPHQTGPKYQAKFTSAALEHYRGGEILQ